MKRNIMQAKGSLILGAFSRADDIVTRNGLAIPIKMAAYVRCDFHPANWVALAGIATGSTTDDLSKSLVDAKGMMKRGFFFGQCLGSGGNPLETKE